MSKLEITKGEYVFAEQDLHTYIHINGKQLCSFIRRNEEKTKATGELFCDAGNTYQRCGLLPSELEKQRDELKAALFDMVWQFAYFSCGKLMTGGMSALEDAFDVLGLSDPITEEEFERKQAEK